jgi:hypothetical protein
MVKGEVVVLGNLPCKPLHGFLVILHIVWIECYSHVGFLLSAKWWATERFVAFDITMDQPPPPFPGRERQQESE